MSTDDDSIVDDGHPSQDGTRLPNDGLYKTKRQNHLSGTETGINGKYMFHTS
jgi:hypothetical protein